MVLSRFSDLTELYHCSEVCTITSHPMSDPALCSFYRGLHSFVQKLGEAAEDDYWKPYLRRLRRYRFELCASLLPPDHPEIYSEEAFRQLSAHLRQCDMVYPAFAEPARDLLEQARSLAQREEHPLLEALTTIDFPDAPGETALLISEARLMPAVAAELEPYVAPGEISVVSAPQLRHLRRYARIIAIGPPYWFPPYVFDAPRSEHITAIHYDWLPDRRKAGPVLASSSSSQPAADTETGHQAPKTSSTVTTSLQESPGHDELLPEINRRDRFDEALRCTPFGGEAEGNVARLFLLAGGYAVFLEAAEGAKVHIIDMEEDREFRVRRTQVNEIEPGMFVLLRTRGGGDYIVSVADGLLGDDAAYCRGIQRLWKERLRKAVQESSLSNVCTRLRRLGCQKYDEGNVKNWMSDRNIRTDRYEDFAAIMSLVGLADHAREYWNTMGRINTAHRRAGFYIRHKLMEQILVSDLEELERMGMMNFELPEAAGGSLTAFRVEDISTETRTVPSPHLNSPFQPGRDAWQE